MIDTRSRISEKLQNCVDTLSGPEGLKMLDIIILGHMKLGSSVNEVNTTATMGASSSTGMLSP